MNWRLLALDLDGTLLEPDDSILPELVSRLSVLAAAGGQIAIASGRPIEDIGAILDAVDLGTEAAWPAALVANERDVYLRNGARLVPDEAWNGPRLAEERRNLPALRRELDAWLADRPDREAFRRYDDAETEDRRGVVALCGASLAVAVESQAELNRRLAACGLPIRVFRNREMLVFRHAGVCKGRAVLRVAQTLGVAPGDALAVGDSDNDRGMLDGRLGFRSACPANAEPDIQALVRANGGVVATRTHGAGVMEILGQA